MKEAEVNGSQTKYSQHRPPQRPYDSHASAWSTYAPSPWACGSKPDRVTNAAEINGISHFVEHMVFKGTRSRTAQSIAREVDAIGGNLDAFTGKESICLNIKVLDEHVPLALDVLSDMVMNPIFANDDILRERGVILEEIKMDEDNPDYLISEIFTQTFWKDHPLGKPILGTRETVKSFEHDTLFGYYGERFHGGNIIFSAAGNLEHDDLCRKRDAALRVACPQARTASPGKRPRPSPASSCATRRRWSRCSSASVFPHRPLPHEQRYVSAAS